MTYTLAQKLLQTHQEEVAQRAAEGGHDLGDWQRITAPSLFDFVAVCSRCGQRAFVSETAVYIAFVSTCPEGGETPG